MTNFERIKNMSVEEMAILMDKIITSCNLNGYYNKQLFCKGCPVNRGNCSATDFGCWLESEVEE
jgi:hypothetical protein